jgi:hypothetical protein
MPQKYQVELPDGSKYEIEEPAKGSWGRSAAEVVKGAGSELKDQGTGMWELAKSAGRNILKNPSNLNPAALASTLAQQSSVGAGLDALDPTGVSSIVKSDESTERKAGRGAVLATETFLPFLRGLGKAGKMAKGAAGAGKATTTGGLLTSAAKTGTDIPLMQPPIKPAPGGAVFATSKPPVPPAAATSGSSMRPGAMRVPVGASQRPNQFSMRVPDKPITTAPQTGAGMAEVPPPATSAANAVMKAEAAAEAAAAGRKEAPGRPPVYGGVERRSPSRVSGAAEDKAYREVRQRLEEKAARERAKAMLTGSKQQTKNSAPLKAETDQPPAPMASANPGDEALRAHDVPSAVAKEREAPAGATSGVLEGFTRKPTKTLAQMKAEYGAEGAARRAGMSVDELDIRIEAGNDPAKLAKLLRDKFGAEKAARMLGDRPENIRKQSGNTPSRLPDRAVEGIKRAAERELAENGKVSDKTQALLDRIKSERGAASPKLMAILGGGAAGAAYGATQGEDDDERMGNAVLGGLGGAVAPAALLNPARVKGGLKIANSLRREAFLTGGAIPKNLLTSLGSTVRAGVEGTASKGRLAPAKEMLRAPTNIKKFWQHLGEPPVKRDPGEVHFGRFAPTKVIGAIDDTAKEALKRAGVDQKNIDRYLLTADRNFTNGMSPLSPQAKTAIDTAFPFQRVPTNVFAEGFNELGHTFSKADLRTALNIAQTAGAYGLGKWAEGDARKKYLVSWLLALSGPNALMSTIAAAQGAGLSGFAAGAIGGISPIPEQAFDPKSFFGVKPAGVTAIKRLSGE